MACDATGEFLGSLGSWSFVKELLVKILVDHKVGFEAFQQHQEDLLSVAFGPSLGCVLGHYSLRLAVLIFSHPAERWQQLQEEELPWHWASTVEVLQSGWPIFGLLGLIAYKLSRDGAGKGVVCDQPIESFRIRYEEVMLYGKEVPFSTDVENTADELLQRLQSNRTMGRMNRACLLGAGLPLMGYGASISCSARREPGLKQLLEKLLEDYEEVFLRPAAAVIPGVQHSSSVENLANLVSSGMWAAESLHLLQRISEAFNTSLSHESRRDDQVLVSVDPFEDQFHGYGLPAFTSHLWADSERFKVHEGLSCPDVMVARDSLPSVPFLGAIVYVDHEAGIGPGRDAGRLAEVLAKYRVVYLGVLAPQAATRCLSRWGTPPQQSRRVCAKVFDQEATWPAPSTLTVLHIPYASSSFAARSHSPLDLLKAGAGHAKKHFLAYMAYACVDHRDLLFDLLVQRAAAGTDLDAPVALSRCAGFRSQHRRQRRNHTRGVALSFLDEAVELLRPYRFALVFENKLVPGYVTEKIVNAFLAGCIPIYWGSRAVLEIFNPESFIYANDIQAPGFSDEQLFDPLMHLERVAEHVLRIAQDPVALEGMANTPALDAKRLQRFFSWHRGVRRHLAALPVPDAADEAVPQRLARALPRLQRRRRCAGGRRGTCVEDVDEPVM
ncbi:unnamed protein product [Durusdinium trenchii]|uniref:Fucosyltransferase n=1 Tax=Durusdinium trenchii TaxID=1381693 RepID=A0ABP0SRI0_9DINO